MRNRTRTLAAASGMLLVASAAGAHPGHGLGGGSTHWLHYLSDPLHIAPFALVALTLALVWWRRRRPRAPAR